MPLEDPLPIVPRGPLDARVTVPGSKSLTNRALLVAALDEAPKFKGMAPGAMKWARGGA